MKRIRCGAAGSVKSYRSQKPAKAWSTHGMVSRISGKGGAPGKPEEFREGHDLKTYPNDGNGDVLRRMEARGDDLARPRNIDFTVVFVDAVSAEQFAEHFHALGHKVSVEHTETKQDFPWDVVVVQHMAPSYDGISHFENLLQSVADRWGGHNDGWGCFSVPRLT